MAGGKGTRLSSITKNEIPKPMVEICGRPLLWYQIDVLKRNGIKDIYIIVGYKGDKIVEYFKDGSQYGVNIQYIIEKNPLGTAGALFFLKNDLKDDFLLLFGDLIFDICIDKYYSFHKSKNALVTLFVHPNSHPYDSDLVILSSDGKVIGFDSKHNIRNYYYKNRVNAGIYFFKSDILDRFSELQKYDLEKDILVPIVLEQGPIYGYTSPEYVKDVGTPERIKKATIELESGLISAKNLKNKQCCIFMDRDGTINRYKGLVYRHEDFELEAKSAEAIKKINDLGFLSIVITNQPVVARGLCDITEVETIHKKMETLIGKKGAYLDDILYCPHHPDKGYPEENPLYKINCNCRKPDIGLINKCINNYNIDVNSSWFIGDSTVDVMTGKNAGLKTILVKTGVGGQDKKYDVIPDKICNDLFAAIKYIEKESIK